MGAYTAFFPPESPRKKWFLFSAFAAIGLSSLVPIYVQASRAQEQSKRNEAAAEENRRQLKRIESLAEENKKLTLALAGRPLEVTFKGSAPAVPPLAMASIGYLQGTAQRDDAKRETVVTITLHNYGEAATTTSIATNLLVGALSFPQQQPKGRLAPKQSVGYQFVRISPAEEYSKVWDGTIRFQVQVQVDFETYKGHPATYLFAGRLDPTRQQIVTLQEEER